MKSHRLNYSFIVVIFTVLNKSNVLLCPLTHWVPTITFRTGTIFIITILIVPRKLKFWKGNALPEWQVVMDATGAWIQVFWLELPCSSLFPMLTPCWSSWLSLSLIVYTNTPQPWVKIWRIDSTLLKSLPHWRSATTLAQPVFIWMVMKKAPWQSICNSYIKTLWMWKIILI